MILFFLPSCCCYQTIENLPERKDLLEQLSEKRLQQYKALKENPTVHRIIRQQFESHPDIFNFLLDHPEFAATTMRELGLSDYVITKKEESHFAFDDSTKINGNFSEWLRNKDQRLYLAQVVVTGPFGIKIPIEILAHCTYEQEAHTGLMINTLEVWLNMRGFAASLVKVMSPLLNEKLDKRVSVFISAAQTLAAELNNHPDTFIKKMEERENLDQAIFLKLKQLLKQQQVSR